MSKDANLAELKSALKRLLEGNPIRVKQTGKLTLNKINREAGLSHSHIHKFKDFVEQITPDIEAFNSAKLEQLNDEYGIETSILSDIDRLRKERDNEKRLKEKYKAERDDAVEAQKFLEETNSTLLFRLYELQQKLLEQSHK